MRNNPLRPIHKRNTSKLNNHRSSQLKADPTQRHNNAHTPLRNQQPNMPKRKRIRHRRRHNNLQLHMVRKRHPHNRPNNKNAPNNIPNPLQQLLLQHNALRRLRHRNTHKLINSHNSKHAADNTIRPHQPKLTNRLRQPNMRKRHNNRRRLRHNHPPIPMVQKRHNNIRQHKHTPRHHNIKRRPMVLPHNTPRRKRRRNRNSIPNRHNRQRQHSTQHNRSQRHTQHTTRLQHRIQRLLDRRPKRPNNTPNMQLISSHNLNLTPIHMPRTILVHQHNIHNNIPHQLLPHRLHNRPRRPHRLLRIHLRQPRMLKQHPRHILRKPPTNMHPTPHTTIKPTQRRQHHMHPPGIQRPRRRQRINDANPMANQQHNSRKRNQPTTKPNPQRRHNNMHHNAHRRTRPRRCAVLIKHDNSQHASSACVI
ncbi:Uncharacterised protein [uncultured archaeon]|nr:Uncharacterised protein [uncultured archaeon]